MFGFQKYLAVFRINLQDYFSYRFEFFGRFVFLAIILFVYAQLWQNGLTSTGVKSLGGYSFASLIWYVTIAEILALSMVKVYEDMDLEIKSGSIAYLLNKPMNYVGYYFAKFLAQTLPALAMNTIVGFGLAWFFAGAIAISLESIAFLVITGFFCFVLIFLLSFLMGLFAFWTEDVRAFGFFHQKAMYVFGGLVIPLELFPGWLKTIADVLPFKYTLYAAANLFVFPSFQKFLAIVTMQLFWFVVLSVIVWIVFLRGRRKISIMGG